LEKTFKKLGKKAPKAERELSEVFFTVWEF
jgi:hypothetical protein